MHWNISNVQDNQRRYFSIWSIFFLYHWELLCQEKKNQTFASVSNKQYQLYCWSHSSFPCSEPWVHWRNGSQRKSVRNFGLCSCSVLVIMDRFLTSEPYTPFLCYGSLVHSSLHRPNHIVSVWKEIQLKFFVQYESSHPMPLLWFNDHLTRHLTLRQKGLKLETQS